VLASWTRFKCSAWFLLLKDELLAIKELIFFRFFFHFTSQTIIEPLPSHSDGVCVIVCGLWPGSRFQIALLSRSPLIREHRRQHTSKCRCVRLAQLIVSCRVRVRVQLCFVDRNPSSAVSFDNNYVLTLLDHFSPSMLQPITRFPAATGFITLPTHQTPHSTHLSALCRLLITARYNKLSLSLSLSFVPSLAAANSLPQLLLCNFTCLTARVKDIASLALSHTLFILKIPCFLLATHALLHHMRLPIRKLCLLVRHNWNVSKLLDHTQRLNCRFLLIINWFVYCSFILLFNRLLAWLSFDLLWL
jgi:hypothetical protein